MKHHQNSTDKTPHAPGTGSDKQHPETPADANERFNKQKKDENTQDSSKK